MDKTLIKNNDRHTKYLAMQEKNIDGLIVRQARPVGGSY